MNDASTTMKLQALIADLCGRVELLASNVYQEEKQAGIFDVSDIAYSVLARNLRTRRENLLATITMLESQFDRRTWPLD